MRPFPSSRSEITPRFYLIVGLLVVVGLVANGLFQRKPAATTTKTATEAAVTNKTATTAEATSTTTAKAMTNAAATITKTAASTTKTAATETKAREKSTQVASAKAPEAAPKAEAQKAAASGVRIQLASMPSEAAAWDAWKRLSVKYAGHLSGLTAIVEPADLGTKGTFYRVQTGPFQIVAAAQARCTAMKAAGLDCLVVRKPASETNTAKTATPKTATSAAFAIEKTIEQLLKQLQVQEFLIKHLMRRVHELEQRVGTPTIAPREATGGNQNAVPVPVADNAPGQSAQESPPVPPEVDEEQNAGRVPVAANAPGQSAQEPPPMPSEVDEEAAERALERTLTAEGALLLPSGTSEVEPSFTYTRHENDNAALFLVDGNIILGTREIERDEFTSSLDYRIGLPLDAQLELGIPYNVVSQSIVDDSGGLNETSATGHGIGDPSIGIAKTLMRENGWRPDLIARVTYDSNLGEKVDNDVALGAGFHEIRGSLTALKRQDPLAFVGTLSYEKSFESDDVEPGDEFGLSLLTLLAASPETSLRLGLQQAYSDDFEVDGSKVDGSDQLQASAIFGVSTILGRGMFLDVSAGVGLTDDSPDYFVGLSLPIRFDFPGR